MHFPSSIHEPRIYGVVTLYSTDALTVVVPGGEEVQDTVDDPLARVPLQGREGPGQSAINEAYSTRR